MLPLWPEPDNLILSNKALVLHRRGTSYSAPLSLDSSEQIDFDALSASLPRPFQKLSGRKLNIVLANCWLRYLILPWQQHVYAYEDWLALARNRLREEFGHRAVNWDVQISMQGYGHPVLVVAAEKQLAEGLDRLAEQKRWQLQRTEPAFVSLVNHYPRYWRGDSWLLMADNNRLLLAESKAGIWQRFSLMLSSAELMHQQALMLIQQARQFNPDNRKRRLYLFRTGALPKQDFIEDMDVRLLKADWLQSDGGRGQP